MLLLVLSDGLLMLMISVIIAVDVEFVLSEGGKAGL